MARNSMSEKIDKDTGLDVGEKFDDKKLIDQTTDELIANKIKVVKLKIVYNNHKNSKIKTVDVANTYEGIGYGFPDNDIQWWPFIYFERSDSNSSTRVGDDPETNKLSGYLVTFQCKKGFALSSENLQLQEG